MKTATSFLLAAAFAASAGIQPASAEVRLWDGSLVVEAATEQCDAYSDVIGSYRAVYRPHLQASDPKAAIMVQTADLSHILLLQATTANNSLNGSGPYCGTDFDSAKGESTDWCGGTYQFTVTPTTVAAGTQEVTLSGRVTKFANIAGCTIRVRGAFRSRPGPGM